MSQDLCNLLSTKILVKFLFGQKISSQPKRQTSKTINSLQNTNGRFIFNEEKQISIFEESEEDNEFSKEKKKDNKNAEFEIESLEDLIDLSEKILPEDELELAKIDPKIIAVQKLLKNISTKKTCNSFSKYTDTVEFIEEHLKNYLKTNYLVIQYLLVKGKITFLMT